MLRNIYTSIDIGTDTIKVIVCELFNDELHLLAESSNKSKGIKKGLIVDMNEALLSVRNGVDEVESKLGIKIENVLITIPSYNATFSLISGNVGITDNKVKKIDIINALQSGVKQSELEMVTILPINFTVDGVTTKTPLGMEGNNLEAKAILVETPAKNMLDILKLMQMASLNVVDISIGGICDMCALKNNDIDSLVGIIVNIGSELTTISLYNKSVIISNRVIEIGGKAIDNDLSYIYKTSMYDAKKLKENFSTACLKYANASDIYDLAIENGQTIKVNQYEVSEIVVARLDEILRTVKKEIASLTNKDLDYIIFTGGTSNILDFEYLVDDIFGNISRIAKTDIIGLRNIRYTTALGNIIYYINKQKLVGEIKGMVLDDSLESLSSLKKNTLNISNDSMLGKVANYFLGE